MALTDQDNRFEFKYMVPSRDVARIVEELGEWVSADGNAEPGRGYSIYSVYWDSPDFRFFWEKVEGLKYRRKLRLRRYGHGGDIHIEIKQRTDRTLQKRRLRWPEARVVEVFGRLAEGTLPPDEDLGEPVAAEAAVLCHRFRLLPRVAIRYRRRAFFGRFEPGIRVTIDSRVQYRADRGIDLTTPFDEGKYVVDPRGSIMEIKFTGRVPLWLSRVVSRHDLSLIRMSKYCTAVDREYHGGTFT